MQRFILGLAVLALVASCGVEQTSSSAGSAVPDSVDLQDRPHWLPDWVTDEVLTASATCDYLDDPTVDPYQAPLHELNSNSDVALLVDGPIALGESVSPEYRYVELGEASIIRLDRSSDEGLHGPLRSEMKPGEASPLISVWTEELVPLLRPGRYLLTLLDGLHGSVVSNIFMVGPNEELVALGWCEQWFDTGRLIEQVEGFEGTELELITGPSLESIERAVGAEPSTVSAGLIENGLGGEAATGTMRLYVPAASDGSEPEDRSVCVSQTHDLCMPLSSGALLPYDVVPDMSVSIVVRDSAGAQIGSHTVLDPPLPAAIKIDATSGTLTVDEILAELWERLGELGTEPALTAEDGRLHLPNVNSVEELERLIDS